MVVQNTRLFPLTSVRQRIKYFDINLYAFIISIISNPIKVMIFNYLEHNVAQFCILHCRPSPPYRDVQDEQPP